MPQDTVQATESKCVKLIEMSETEEATGRGESIEIQRGGLFVVYSSVGFDWVWLDHNQRALSSSIQADTYAYTGFQLKVSAGSDDKTLTESKLAVNMSEAIHRSDRMVKTQSTLYTARVVRLQACSRLSVVTLTPARVSGDKHQTFVGVFPLVVTDRRHTRCKRGKNKG